MDIMIKHKRSESFLSKFSYLKKVVERFRMQEDKIINTHLGQHIKYLIMQYPRTAEENKMAKITPYAIGGWKHHV